MRIAPYMYIYTCGRVSINRAILVWTLCPRRNVKSQAGRQAAECMVCRTDPGGRATTCFFLFFSVLLGGCLVWWPRRSLETAWSPVISGWLLARSAVLITGHSRPCRSVAATTGVVVNKPVPDVCLVWSHSKNHGRRTCSANNPA